jgi:aminoglycoside phosphotransferase
MTDILRTAFERPSAEAGWQFDRARVVYVRYMPSVSCNIVYALDFSDLETSKSAPRLLCCKVLPGDDAAGYLIDRERKLSATDVIGPKVLRFEDLGLVATMFPNDLRLSRLRLLFHHERLHKALCEALELADLKLSRNRGSSGYSEIFSYKPERSCLVGCAIEHPSLGDGISPLPVFARLYRGRKGGEIHAAMKTIWNSPQRRDCSLSVAEPLGYAKDTGLLVQSCLAGQRLRGSTSDPATAQGIVLAGGALAQLHAIPYQIARSRRGDNLLDGPAQIMGRFSGNMAWVRRRGEGLVGLLKAVEQPESSDRGAIVHGDFGPGQVLVNEHGVSIIDFDHARMGDRYEDVACFTTRLTIASLERYGDADRAERLRANFLDAYKEASGQSLDQRALIWHEAFYFLRAAESAARHIRPGWRARVERRFCCTEDAIARGL